MEKLKAELDRLIAELPNAEAFRNSIDDNILEFTRYEVKPDKLLKAVRDAYKRQMAKIRTLGATI